MNEKQSLTFSKQLHVPIQVVYEACTNLTVLPMWLCDVAEADPTVGGHFYAWWNQGYYTSGTYTEVEKPSTISWTWQGSTEPGPSKVTISLKEEDGGTSLTLTHSELGAGEAWQSTIERVKVDWPKLLTNLQWAVEKGVDKRVFGRPFMGILINGIVDEETAKRLGVPETKGVWISGTAEGTGAAESDLLADDVIHKLGDTDITSFQSFGPALASYEPEDIIELGVYRGGDSMTIPVKLSKRPLPEVPITADDLAAKVQAEYRMIDKEIAGIFQGVSEEGATRRPAPEEWSAKETLAHILYSEQFLQMMLTLRIGGHRGLNFHNDLAIISGIAGGYPTTTALLEALKQSEEVTVSMLSNLEDDFIARKFYYVGLANLALEGFPGHTRSHYDQMKAAIQAAKTSE